MTVRESTDIRPLRLWPGVAIVILQWLVRFAVPVVAPEAVAYGVMGGMAGGLAIAVWWLFFSRAPWSERLGAIVLIMLALFATSRIIHESIATGAMGMLFPLLAIPVVSLAFVVWAAASRRLSNGARWAALAAVLLLACGVFTLVRTGGFTANFDNDFAWRWSQTPEERLLAQPDEPPPVPVAAKAPEDRLPAPAAAEPEPPPVPAAAKTPVDGVAATAGDEAAALPLPAAAGKKGAAWPGFRGANRDGIVRGLQIETNWSASPPVELWRRPIGPGWSSFAVRGDLLYTQEQRGDDEVVACYNATNGQPVWRHRDEARFWESNGGAGPRATPTLSNGRVYTLGATGIVNALDAANGAVVWSRNAASDTGAKVQYWGFSSSPLVVDDVVVVYAGGLAAYDLATGALRWAGGARRESYSSPHLMTIAGVRQIVMLSEAGATGIAPADGAVLWEHSWPGSPIAQPALTADGDVLIATTGGNGAVGTRRIGFGHESGGWTVEARWTSIGLKPYFNDFVIHGGHAFGFDGSILASIDITDGQRKWKGGRYGNGQLVLLADQDLLLVLSEEGELALVAATPDKFTELAKFKAIEGKTWNHPVLASNLLLIRNGEEMAAFRLPLAQGTRN